MKITRRSMLRSLVALAVAVPFVPRLIAARREGWTVKIKDDATGVVESRSGFHAPSSPGTKTVTLESNGIVLDTDSFTVI